MVVNKPFIMLPVQVFRVAHYYVCHHLVHSQRYFSTTLCLLKTIPNNLKGKSTSSQDWLIRQLNDPYVKKARYANYRARSAFKLIEIDDKYKLLKPGMKVIECGAAPGAWTQVLVERLLLSPVTKNSEEGDTIAEPIMTEGRRLGSLVVSIDRNPMHPVPGAIVFDRTDFTSPLLHSRILSILDGRQVDFVCSDMAPNASGQHSLDHDAIMNLCFVSLKFSLQVLRPKTGCYLTKFWDGARKEELTKLLEKFFARVDFVKPPASRVDSSEAFLLGREFKGIKTQ